MSWWDAVRMAWFYWFGLARFLLVFVGWIWGLLRLGVGLAWRTLKSLVTSPFAMLDSSSRQPGVPWIALDRKSTRLNSSHGYISYAVFCLKKKKRRVVQLY